MRDCKINQTTIYYSLYGEEEVNDEWGNDIKGYGEPIPLKIIVSSDSGEANARIWGTNIDYDREMLTHNMSCPIDEYSHLWIDADPKTEPYNYIVKAKGHTKNCIKYAIKKVDVAYENEY